MKTKYPNLFGILAALMLVVSFVLPAGLSPTGVAADPGICKWDTLREPGDLTGTEVIDTCSEPISMAIGSDFNTIYIVIKTPPTSPYGGLNVMKVTTTKGLFWGASPWTALLRADPSKFAATQGDEVYKIVVAADNPKYIAVTASNIQATGSPAPVEVWVSTNGGAKWEFTNLEGTAGFNPAFMTVRDLDISVDYGGTRDIAAAAAGSGAGGDIFVIKSSGFSGWTAQGAPVSLGVTTPADFFAVKFSPSYASDASLAIVFADAFATYYNIALRDIDKNTTLSWAFTNFPGIEVKDPVGVALTSPSNLRLNEANIQLPSDFSGQAASLRRAYVSLDAMIFGALYACPLPKLATDKDGIFRIDDNVVYVLMDTSNVSTKSIYSIAYFGTYASGKLLAGERMGYPCTATVPTWFTDSPTTCPIPCWYPCLKCPTGAACQADCSQAQCGMGSAIVGWAPQGNLAYAITASAATFSVFNALAVVPAPLAGAWWGDLIYLASAGIGVAPVCNDESAMSISRNNGETWNQISLIDTTITKFTDVAPTADCKTVYLASVNVCSCTITATANVTCASPENGGCSIELLGEPQINCAGVTLLDYEFTGGGCTYDPDNCTCTFAPFDFEGSYHCDCSTCSTCEVDFDIPHDALTIHSDNGTPQSVFVPLSAVVDCSTQDGCEGIVGCCCFDSVWRTSFNPDVTSPLAPQPVGTYWERVFTHVTAPSCEDLQTDMALLRVVPYCADPSGQIVAWAVYDPTSINSHGVAAWSPDFGDYWANLTPRNPVQDFTFESQTVLYFLSPGGLVQKMPYTGTAWSSALPDVDAFLAYSHSIAAYPEGKVLVGAGSPYNQTYFATSYCGNFNTDSPTFALQALPGNTGTAGNIHVAFDSEFKDNSTYFVADDAACAGSVFRNNPAAPLRWQDTDLMTSLNGACGCPAITGQFGIALAFTGGALYSANGPCEQGPDVCGVNRTLNPLAGIPKPGVCWDHLDVGLPAAACFTLEPSSLKLCGCCTLDTDTTLYAIDDANYNQALNQGLIWAFTDCLAKRGPALITEDQTLIGCDPVSGRAQEVNLCWEQLCVADKYDIEIAKDAAFTIRVIDWASSNTCDADNFLKPVDITSPCVFFPAGGMVQANGSAIALSGNLECGHTYYWRVAARECATGQVIRSPNSEVRSFTVKAGLPVVSPYLGLQLLAPNNGCMGCPTSPASFSWSPFKETTKYKFVLAKDSEMTQVVKEAEVTTTAYEYDGTLDYSTNYFWRVMSEEPAPSDWSATFSFQTEAQPAPPSGPATPAPTPIWVWVVIAIGAILVIVTLVLIFKTRRV